MKRKNHSIFISYRREGGDLSAKMIYDALTKEGYSVFMDIESLRSGKFSEALTEKIDECEDFLLILPPAALNRCNDKYDWVRREIEYAINKKKNIIPVILRGFSWPSDDELPYSLRGLRYYNGIAANGENFEQSIERMMTFFKTENPQKKRRKLAGYAAIFAVVLILSGMLGYFVGYYGTSNDDDGGNADDKIETSGEADPNVDVDLSKDTY